MRHKFILIGSCLFLFFSLFGCHDIKEDVITNPPPEEVPEPEIIEPCTSIVIHYPPPLNGDPDPTIELNDITIGWISRLPAIEYKWGSSHPEIEGWPS